MPNVSNCFRECLKKLVDAKNDSNFQSAMHDAVREFWAGNITAEQFDAFCDAASKLNYISYCIFAKNCHK